MTTERTTEAKIKNFTPLLDELVKECGVITAAVWGRIWRYAQQENNVCQASHEKIADELGISRRTIIRHIKTLVAHGYLKDHTPNLRNKPHTYSITEKARILITIEGVTESHSKGKNGVTESHSGVTESHSQSDKLSHEETIKKEIKKQSAGEFPEQLNTSEFLKAWDEWKTYRLERKHKLTPLTIKKQLKKLSAYSVNVAIAMIDQSIEKGWLGLFELKETPALSDKPLTANDDGSLYV